MPSLSDFYSLEVTRLQGLVSAARAAANLARQGEANASTNLVAANKTLTQARSDAAAARKALARIPLPADGDALLLALRLALRHEASAQSAQVAAALALSLARASRNQADVQMSEWTTRLGQIQAQAKAEQDASLERDLWKAAAAVAAPKDPPSLASEALSLFKAAAKTKIEADFPSNADSSKDFLSRVRARRLLAALPLAQAAQLHDDVAAQATTWQEATGRAADKLPALREDFAAACAALKAYYLAPTTLAAASSQLQALAERVSSPLSAAQRKELFATGNSTLASEREDALAALALRDEAQKTLFQRHQDYVRALLPLQLAHPGSTEADLRAIDASLDTHFSDLTAAAQAVEDADDAPALVAYLQVLMDWFTAVPDALWQQFEALENSIAVLEDIQAMTSASVLSDLQTRENALVAQLQALQKEQTSSDLRASLFTQTEAQTSAAAEVKLSRLAAATRFVELI